MSFPWSEKDLKVTPVDDDEVMLIDSEDTNPETINKRAKLVTLPSSGQINTSSNEGSGVELALAKVGSNLPFRTLVEDTNKIDLTQNAEDITFTLGNLVVTTDQANTYTAGAKQSFVADATTAGININTQVPSTTVPGDIWRTAEFIQFKGVSTNVRTVVITEEAQTLTDKTIDADNNIISNLALGAEVTGASTDLTDSSNIARLDALNDFTAGTQSLFFRSESGSPADTGIIRLARIDDIAWRNFANDGNLLLEVDASEFLTFDSSFIAITVTQGTSGEVLTSNGAGLAPTFENVTSGVFPVPDDVMIIEGSADDTKRLRFEVDGLTAGLTRVITPADADITLVNTTDGTISNANVNALAAIDFSKLALLSSANILVGNGSAIATSVAMTGDIAIDNTGLTSIVSGVIVNDDINASAAIDFSKLASLTSANILVGDGSNVATSVTMTGDITISNFGVTSIGTGVIINADVNASAAIEFSKLESLTSANILVGSGANVATSVGVSGDVNIDNAGLVTAQPEIITDKTLKGSPIGADQVLMSDSEDSDNLKRITISSAVGVVTQGVLMAFYLNDASGVSGDFWGVTGGNPHDGTFIDVATPLPNDMTLSRLTVHVTVNDNIGGEDVDFQFVSGDGTIIGNNNAIILDGNTGSFTDTSSSDAILSGVNISYQSNDDTGTVSDVTISGASIQMRGT